METLMIKSKTSFQQFVQSFNTSTLSSRLESSEPTTATETVIISSGSVSGSGSVISSRSGSGASSPTPSDGVRRRTIMGHGRSLPANATTTTPTTPTDASTLYADNTTGEYLPSYWSEGDEPLAAWNGSYLGGNSTNLTTPYNFSDFELLNATNTSVPYGFWFCAKWVDAQQDLFQAANICFAVAFLIPKSFKQSILFMRALAAIGFLLLAAWAGTELCAPDVLAWNIVLVVVNSIHTILLIIRFLPPALSLELTELYLRLFKPLKVSKKHFKELAREGRLLRLEPGEPYAIESITPADERLSILLKGKLKVSCEQTYLHVIQPHQFIDSPEWEANREQSDDVFQVTVIAEESSICLCWPRMRLERVLRYRPMLKIVLDSIIGKDITHKLYSLNEQQALAANDPNGAVETKIMLRSLSADAVDIGTQGKMRSLVWRDRERKGNSATEKKLLSALGAETGKVSKIRIAMNRFGKKDINLYSIMNISNISFRKTNRSSIYISGPSYDVKIISKSIHFLNFRIHILRFIQI
ncbi:uncharacterized protein LOC143916840 [Arctopsyche grandis]|uniref:uncharacterized protein LOC143916840 n=1 Tax=Arctopsyche grandis TaxID=121162 RepID=UPI00406D8713